MIDRGSPLRGTSEEAAEAPDESVIDLKSILRALQSRWRLALAMPVLTLLAAYGTLKTIPPVYRSTVEIVVLDPRRQADSTAKQLASAPELNSQAIISTEIEMIGSQSLLLRVVKKLHLGEDPEFWPEGKLERILQRVGLLNALHTNSVPDTASREENAALILRSKLVVEQIRSSYVLGLTIDAENPAAAQRLATAIAEDYLDSRRKARLEHMQQVADWLRMQVDDLQSRVATTEATMAKLRAQGGFIETGSSSNINEQRIQELNSQLQLARAEVAKEQAAFDQAQRLLERHGDVTDVPEVMASPFIAQLYQQRSELTRQQAELRATPGTADPVVIQKHLVGLNEAINTEAAHIVGDMKNAYQAALQREKSLQMGLEQLSSAFGSSYYLKLQQLDRVDKADRQLYESYLAQFNEITSLQTFQDASPEIISPAARPISPSKPQAILFYGFGGVFGLGLGLSLALLLEKIRPGVRTSAEAERIFGHPVLGQIPLVKPKKRGQGIEPGSLMQTVVDGPLSQVGEAVRALRINLALLSVDRARQVVLLTSAAIGEGKSSAALLLAASSAESGQSAVLVDCDLRHPTVSRAFGMPQQGLVDLLAGTAELDDVIIPGLPARPDVIAAGAPTVSPTDLLTSQRMRDLIARLHERYDCVVLDASPVLSAIDALVLARMVDKILVIIEWDRTPRDLIAEACKRLRRDGHRIAGIVLNKVDMKQLHTYDAYMYRYSEEGDVHAGANACLECPRKRRPIGSELG